MDDLLRWFEAAGLLNWFIFKMFVFFCINYLAEQTAPQFATNITIKSVHDINYPPLHYGNKTVKTQTSSSTPEPRAVVHHGTV